MNGCLPILLGVHCPKKTFKVASAVNYVSLYEQNFFEMMIFETGKIVILKPEIYFPNLKY